MDELEQEVKSKLFYKLYNIVLDGNDISNEEKMFLLSEIEIYMRYQLSENSKAFRKFKAMAPLAPSLIKSLDFGPGYRENYLGVRKGMKYTIEHKGIVLSGIEVTYNNMNFNNIYTLVRQSDENEKFDEFFCKYIDKVAENLSSENPDYEYSVGKYYAKHMDKTREKILVLSREYQK